MESNFIEVGHEQLCKSGEFAPGDTIVSRKNESTGRVVTVLSDGLGSGIKAGVLSSLTATMALKSIENGIPETRVAETICNTLPVCSERKINYATFTIVDIFDMDRIKVIEYDNPGYLHFRGSDLLNWEKREEKFKSSSIKRNKLFFSDFRVKPGDRVIFFSDGVTQSGLGSYEYPLGWDREVKGFIEKTILEDLDISAQDLSRKIVSKALYNDGSKARDDISCVVIYFRKPRKAILVSGPPVDPKRDYLLSARVRDFRGKKILCGGTTANIISREWGRKVRVPLKNIDFSMPPMGEMTGIDLISEGIITLGKVSEFLEKGIPEDIHSKNPAKLITEALLGRDQITFLLGTKINDAHQDPNMPVELEIRRNIVKKISRILKDKYLKDCHVEFI